MASRCPGTGLSGSLRCRQPWEAMSLWRWRGCVAVEVVLVGSLRESAVPQHRFQTKGQLNHQRRQMRAGLEMCQQRLQRLACQGLHCWVVLGLLCAASPLVCHQRRHSRSLTFHLLWLVLLPLRQQDQCHRLHDPLAWLPDDSLAQRRNAKVGSRLPTLSPTNQREMLTETRLRRVPRRRNTRFRLRHPVLWGVVKLQSLCWRHATRKIGNRVSLSPLLEIIWSVSSTLWRRSSIRSFNSSNTLVPESSAK
mmetsp:Transcript_41331/g.109481  ORF Transcript_41331/g.109481 Transcript_41331/m.109481 type:complete len:251 (+) Transcript_41331:709-1461(+)